MGLLKWTKAEVWCDFPGCYEYITFEGSELKLLDWIRIKDWIAVRGFYFCNEHKGKYIQYIHEILSDNKKRFLEENQSKFE